VTAEPDADRSHRRLWVGAIAVLGALVVVRNLVDLSGSPPGLYVDEASIGYNAWTIAHFGVDEHGIHFPLFFEAFGEYKNPIYVYAVAALVRFLPLTVAVERFPAALFGLAVVGFLTAAAWRMTGSRWITLGTLALTGFTPWLVIESRVGFETISWVALLSAALWCLAGRQPTPRRFGIAGILLAFAIYGYTTARLEVLLIAVALAVAWGLAKTPGWWRALVPIAAGYAVLGVYALLNPGALTGRFTAISIWSDGAPLSTVVDRFLANYLAYFSPNFLFTQGDGNPRQNSEVGGMLLWVTAPLLIAGILVCWQRRREPLVRFLVVCIVLAPVAAALTNNGTPTASARRSPAAPVRIRLSSESWRRVSSLRRRSTQSTSTPPIPTVRPWTSTPARSRRSPPRAMSRARTGSTCRTTSIHRTSRRSSRIYPHRRVSRRPTTPPQGSPLWGCRSSRWRRCTPGIPLPVTCSCSARTTSSTRHRRRDGRLLLRSEGPRMPSTRRRRDRWWKPFTALAADAAPAAKVGAPNKLQVNHD
jgi:hypothetical protein